MSLINDALRRANSQAKEAAVPTGLAVHLHAVEYRRERSAWSYLVVGSVAAGLLGLSAWLFWSPGRPAQKMTLAEERASHRPSAPPTTKVQPVPLPATVVAKEKPKLAVAIDTSLVARTHPVAQAPPSLETHGVGNSMLEAKTNLLPAMAEAPKVELPFPKLKLQGIYFRRTNPSVLINGRSFFVGDRVEGARVVIIDRQSVTVEFGGLTTLLTL